MDKSPIRPPATIHLIGICGTGMGALAGLLVEKGFRVTGSDAHAYPPMSDELNRLGISVMQGYGASNLDHRPDLVVVGNVCRPDHPEAVAAVDRGLHYLSMPQTVEALFLRDARPLVVAGTHGKTTTTALLSYLLYRAGLDPSFLAGGVIDNFGYGYRLGSGEYFVIEGDEYDSAYFQKVAKFLSYRPTGAIVTSVEYDHIDIYSSFDHYKSAFRKFVDLVPTDGIIAVYAGDEGAVEIVRSARSEVIPYAVDGDEWRGDWTKECLWRATPTAPHQFDLRAGNDFISAIQTPIIGRHNLRNTLAAMILCHHVAGVPLDVLKETLSGFQGVRRRQQSLGSPRGVTIYDDFAHHPTAVKETLQALSETAKAGRLVAAFEPRSATACRNVHQVAYITAFDAADRVILAPPGRELPPPERLDTAKLATQIEKRGIEATAADTLDEVLDQILDYVRPGDQVAILSNGSFGGLSKRLIEQLK